MNQSGPRKNEGLSRRDEQHSLSRNSKSRYNADRERQQAQAARKKRDRLTKVVIAVVVVAIVGICTGVAMAVNSGASQIAMQSNDVSGSQQVSVTTDTQSSQTTASSVSDLTWRDTDFAVDPSRTTWNTENNGRKVVYLTFDDGPSANTQKVLDILDQYGCKATFFVTATDPDYFNMIGEAYKRGNTIGLHTASHDYAKVYSSTTAYFEDLDEIGQVVKDQIGYVPCFIRFPGGSSNSVSKKYTSGIMTELASEVQAKGYQYWDWNVSCGDGSNHTADELVSYATDESSNDYSNIVLLMHDSAPKDTSVEALPRIIEYYQSKGYTFEAINRDTKVIHHGINN